MNLRIAIYIPFGDDDTDALKPLVGDIADLLVKAGYGNDAELQDYSGVASLIAVTDFDLTPALTEAFLTSELEDSAFVVLPVNQPENTTQEDDQNVST